MLALKKRFRFLKDFFTSMIDLDWSWTLFTFATAFFTSWLLFACVWYLVALSHGDLGSSLPEDHVHCVENIQGFTSCFLFSLETQHTIGYGTRSDTANFTSTSTTSTTSTTFTTSTTSVCPRSPTTQCPQAVVVISIQSIVGVVIQVEIYSRSTKKIKN